MPYPATATLPPLFAVQRLADGQWLVRTRWATRLCPAPVKITGEYRALLCKRDVVTNLRGKIRTRNAADLGFSPARTKGATLRLRDRPFTHPRV